MARIKPTEVRLVASMLEHEADSADDLAKQIIEALDAKRESDEKWVINFYEPNVKVLANYGPYGTANAAVKDVKKLVAAGPQPAQAQVVKLMEVQE